MTMINQTTERLGARIHMIGALPLPKPYYQQYDAGDIKYAYSVFSKRFR